MMRLTMRGNACGCFMVDDIDDQPGVRRQQVATCCAGRRAAAGRGIVLGCDEERVRSGDNSGINRDSVIHAPRNGGAADVTAAAVLPIMVRHHAGGWHQSIENQWLMATRPAVSRRDFPC